MVRGLFFVEIAKANVKVAKHNIKKSKNDRKLREYANQLLKKEKYSEAIIQYEKIGNKRFSDYKKLGDTYLKHQLQDSDNLNKALECYQNAKHQANQENHLVRFKYHSLAFLNGVASAAITSVPLAIMGLLFVLVAPPVAAVFFGLFFISFVTLTPLYAVNDILDFEKINFRNSFSAKIIKFIDIISSAISAALGAGSLALALGIPSSAPPTIQGVDLGLSKIVEFGITSGAAVGLGALGLVLCGASYFLKKYLNKLKDQSKALNEQKDQITLEELMVLKPQQEASNSANKYNHAKGLSVESIKALTNKLNGADPLKKKNLLEKNAPAFSSITSGVLSALGIAAIGGSALLLLILGLGAFGVGTGGIGFGVAATVILTVTAVVAIASGIWIGYQVYQQNKRMIEKDIEDYQGKKASLKKIVNNCKASLLSENTNGIKNNNLNSENKQSSETFKTQSKQPDKASEKQPEEDFREKLGELNENLKKQLDIIDEEYKKNKNKEQRAEKINQLRNTFSASLKKLVAVTKCRFEDENQQKIEAKYKSSGFVDFIMGSFFPVCIGVVGAVASPLLAIFNVSVAAVAPIFMGASFLSALSMFGSTFAAKLGGVKRATQLAKLDKETDQCIEEIASEVVIRAVKNKDNESNKQALPNLAEGKKQSAEKKFGEDDGKEKSSNLEKDKRPMPHSGSSSSVDTASSGSSLDITSGSEHADSKPLRPQTLLIKSSAPSDLIQNSMLKSKTKYPITNDVHSNQKFCIGC